MQSLGTNPAEIGLQTHAAPDRRRKLRHKVRLPAYASLNASASTPALELSEIVDISEDGMAIQTSADLGVDQQARFLLDLPETHALLPVEGTVIWTGLSGRAGVQFSEMPEEMSAPLKKWLFANAIAACAQQPGGTTDQRDEDFLPAEDGVATLEPLPPTQADHTSILAALAAVKREVEGLGTDLDAALCLIVRRAHSFTQASGAAIALADQQEIICRATVGHDAPPLGARLQIGSGFSGECVQTGLLLRCDDAELDPRVNRESCRALGIRSMAAIPIRSNGSILGLLEVFSPEVRAFGSEAESILSSLAELASAAVCRAESRSDAGETTSATVDDEFLVEDHTALSIPELSRSRNGLLIAAAVTLVFVILWLIATWDRRTPHTTAPTQSKEQVVTTKPQPVSVTVPASDLQTMLRLAEQGDPIAQFAVGARYATGEDVSQDYAEAVRWFSKAAEQGHVPAQATLGAYYWAGRGVPADLSKAYFWSVLAEAGGDEASKSRVALLASRLDRAQIVIAQHQADEWIRKHQLAGKSSGTTQ